VERALRRIDIKRKPTLKQIRAYYYVFIAGYNYKQTATLMGISRQAVYRLLKRLKKTNPHLFTSTTFSVNIFKKNKKILSYCNSMDCRLITKF